MYSCPSTNADVDRTVPKNSDSFIFFHFLHPSFNQIFMLVHALPNLCMGFQNHCLTSASVCISFQPSPLTHAVIFIHRSLQHTIHLVWTLMQIVKRLPPKITVPPTVRVGLSKSSTLAFMSHSTILTNLSNSHGDLTHPCLSSAPPGLFSDTLS